VLVIDTATNTVIGTITVGDRPEAVAVSPEGDRIYVTNNFNNNVRFVK
jgi:DNA-binding beta-propeller fold protein YncE